MSERDKNSSYKVDKSNIGLSFLVYLHDTPNSDQFISICSSLVVQSFWMYQSSDSPMLLVKVFFLKILRQQGPRCLLCCLIINALEELQGAMTHSYTQTLQHKQRQKHSEPNLLYLSLDFCVTVAGAVYRERDYVFVCVFFCIGKCANMCVLLTAFFSLK